MGLMQLVSIIQQRMFKTVNEVASAEQHLNLGHHPLLGAKILP